MKTGFTDLDKHIGGFNGGELIILGGRPGMGKTSLAVDIVRNCGGKSLYISFYDMKQARKVWFFSIILHTLPHITVIHS